MAASSEKKSQIEKFLTSKSSMELQKQFDLNQWECELRELADSNDYKELVNSIRSYIESMIIYVSDENYQQQTLIAKKCFIVMKDIIKDDWRDVFMKNITKLVFDIIIEENEDYWCIKKELLTIFNNWAKKTSKATKHEIITGLSQMYLYKMVDNITSYGDYDLQLTIIEAIFRMYGKSEINKSLNDLIPESEELSQTLADINPARFDEDCRLFLNAINEKYEKIFSILCDRVQIGHIICEQPTTDIDGLWVDFNIRNKALSWCYLRKDGSNEIIWELITLFASELEHAEIKSTPNMYCIQFILSGHLITSSGEESSFLNQAKDIIIILKRNEKSEQLVTSVLPKLLDDQPSPKPTKKCSRASKMAYKALDVKVSKSANKSFLSKSEVSSMYNPLQPMPMLTTSIELKVSSKSEDEVITIASTEDPNKYLSLEDTSPVENSQRPQILSGKCTTPDFKYSQIISSQSKSVSMDNYSTAEGHIKNSIKVSTYNNSSTDKWKTAEEGSSENYKVQQLTTAKVLKVSHKSNFNKEIVNRELIEDFDSMKVNIHEYDLTEKENLNKDSLAKYKEGSKPKISGNIKILQKHEEEINLIQSLDDSLDFAEKLICSSEVIPKSIQKTSLNILTQEVDATKNARSNVEDHKEDEAVNLGIVTEEHSIQLENHIEILEPEKKPKISKKISPQEIENAEEGHEDKEMIEKEKIDVIQKVSKFKNKKIFKAEHKITETNAFLREDSSKPYKHQSKRIHLLDGTDKKKTEDEAVNLEMVTEEDSTHLKNVIEISEPEEEITKKPKISKNISQQEIKNAEEGHEDEEIIKREQIDVIQKVSKSKNKKISIAEHTITETNAFLREDSSKPYKHQSNRIHLLDGTDKKKIEDKAVNLGIVTEDHSTQLENFIEISEPEEEITKKTEISKNISQQEIKNAEEGHEDEEIIEKEQIDVVQKVSKFKNKKISKVKHTVTETNAFLREDSSKPYKHQSNRKHLLDGTDKKKTEDEAVNLGIVTEDHSTQLENFIEISEPEEEITKKTEISKNISQQEIKNAEEGHEDEEMIEREQIDVVQKVSKFKNKRISKAEHTITETTAFLREDFSKPYKHQSNRIHLLDGTDKKKTEDEAVNLGIVTEDHSTQLENFIEISEPEEEITKKTEISKNIAQQEIKNAEEGHEDEEIIEKEQIDVVQKVSKFKNKKISKVKHAITETNGFLREDSSKPYKHQSNRENLVDDIDKKEIAETETFLEDVDSKRNETIKKKLKTGKQKIVKKTLNIEKKIFKSKTKETKHESVEDGDEEQSKEADDKKRRYPKRRQTLISAIKENDISVKEVDNEEYKKNMSAEDIEDVNEQQLKETDDKKSRYRKRRQTLISAIKENDISVKEVDNAEYKKNMSAEDIEDVNEQQLNETDDKKSRYPKRRQTLTSAMNKKYISVKDVNNEENKENISAKNIEDGDTKQLTKTDKKRIYSKQRRTLTLAMKVKDISIKEVDNEENKENDIEDGDIEQLKKTDDDDDKKPIYPKQRQTLTSAMKEKDISVKEVDNEENRKDVSAEDIEDGSAKQLIKADDKKRIYPKQRRTLTSAMKEKDISIKEVDNEENKENDIEYGDIEQLKKKDKKRIYPKQRRTLTLAMKEKDIFVKEVDNEENKENDIEDCDIEQLKKTDDKKRIYPKQRRTLTSAIKEKYISVKEVDNEENKENEIEDGDIEQLKKTDDKKRIYPKQRRTLTSAIKEKDISVKEVDNEENKENDIEDGDIEQLKKTDDKKRIYPKQRRTLTSAIKEKDISVKEVDNEENKENDIEDGDIEQLKKTDDKKRIYPKQRRTLTSAIKDKDISAKEVDNEENKENEIEDGDIEQLKKTDDKKRIYPKQRRTLTSAIKEKDISVKEVDNEENKENDIEYGDIEQLKKTDDKKRIYPKQRRTLTSAIKEKYISVKEVDNEENRKDVSAEDIEDGAAKQLIKTDDKKRIYPKQRRTLTSAIKEKYISVKEVDNEENRKDVSAEDIEDGAAKHLIKTDDKKRIYPKQRRTLTSAMKEKDISIKEVDDEENKENEIEDGDIEQLKKTDDKKRIYPKQRRTLTSAMKEKYITVKEINNEENKKDVRAENIEDVDTKLFIKTDDKKRIYPKQRRTLTSAIKEKDISVQEVNAEDIEDGDTKQLIKTDNDNKRIYPKQRRTLPSAIKEKDISVREVSAEDIEDGYTKQLIETDDNKRIYPKQQRTLTSAMKEKDISVKEVNNEENKNDMSAEDIILVNDNFETVKSPKLSQNLPSDRSVSKKNKTTHPYLTPTSNKELKVAEVIDNIDKGISQSQLDAYEIPTQKNTPSDMDNINKYQQKDINIGNNSQEYVPVEPEIRKIIDPEKEFDNLKEQIDSKGSFPIKQIYKKSDQSKTIDSITTFEDTIHLALSPDVEGYMNDEKITLPQEKQFAQNRDTIQVNDQYNNIIGDIIIIGKHPSPKKGSVQEMVVVPSPTEKVKVVQFDVKSHSNSSIRTRDLNQTISTSFSGRKRKLYTPDDTIYMKESLLEVKKPKKCIEEIKRDVSHSTIFTKGLNMEESLLEVKKPKKFIEEIKRDVSHSTIFTKGLNMEESLLEVKKPKKCIEEIKRDVSHSSIFTKKQHKKGGTTKKRNSRKRNETTLEFIQEENRQLDKKIQRCKKLNATIGANSSMTKFKATFRRFLDAWRQAPSEGKIVVDDLKDKDKDKKRKTKSSEKNRKLSIRRTKEKTREASTPKSKTEANRVLNDFMDISDINDELVKRPRVRKHVPVSNLVESTKNIEDISTPKRSMDKKKEQNKIVVLSDIKLDPWNGALSTKLLKEQRDKDEYTECISQKSNVEEPTMGRSSYLESYQKEKTWEMEGLMYQLAPSWTATAFFNDEAVTIKSSDYNGKYLVLFFYPLDFADYPYAAPPSEIFAINNAYESFIKLNTEVIGCSVDFYFTHRAWLNNCYKLDSNSRNLKFPLLADTNHRISKAYMMYSDKLNHSFRGFFIMDPEGIIFSIVVAELNMTIPLDEILSRIRSHQSHITM